MASQLVKHAQQVIQQYDIRLTVRQIYYRLVAAGRIKNTRSSYNALDKALTTARLRGVIPFRVIEDRSRRFLSGDANQLRSPEDFIHDALTAFRHLDQEYEVPFWLGQPEYVEVWVEKDALSTLFMQICGKYHVRLFPSRGYASVTSLHEAARYLANIGKPTSILYFGDFDMRGLDIERYVADRLRGFGIVADVSRIALTTQQVEAYKLPCQPAKKTDTLARQWMELQGDVAWELDALDPNVLLALVENAVLEHLDKNLLQSRNQLLEQSRETIRELVQNLVTKLD